jgi:hypothetical protein
MIRIRPPASLLSCLTTGLSADQFAGDPGSVKDSMY